MRTLLLIDGHNFLFRAYSVPFSFHSSKGTPLHVVTTYLKILRRAISVIDTEDTIYIAVVFDSQEPTTNHALLDTYKANRQQDFPEDDNPFIHLSLIQKALDILNIPFFEIPTIEADDIIATFTSRFKEQYIENNVYIASHDSDFYQLIDDRTNIIHLFAKDKTDIIDATFIFNTFGIAVSEYVYFKSLIGDKADNIESIPSIGPVRARKIIRKELIFDTTTFINIIDRNISLITLNTNVGISFDLEKLMYKNTLDMSNADIFDKAGF